MVRTARSVVYGVCLLLLFHSVLLHADVIPGRWEKVEVQKQGTELTLILQSGEPVYGLLKEVTHDTVIVIEEGGVHLQKTRRFRISYKVSSSSGPSVRVSVRLLATRSKSGLTAIGQKFCMLLIDAASSLNCRLH